MDGPNPNRTTPGIYSQELDAFPPSIAGVQTAVPAFIGYTEKASLDGKSVFLTPIPVSSMAEFESTFGVGFKQVYNIVEVTAISSSSGAPVNWDFQVGDSYYRLQRMNALFNLYWSMRLFFANGGGSCYVVSVGDYTHSGQSPSGVAVDEADLIKGLGAIREQAGPTMLVIPDAVLLPDLGSFAMIAQAMLTQSGALQDRMALLDVYGAEAVNQKNVSTALDPVITAFQSSVGGNSLSYGSAYFPFLNKHVMERSRRYITRQRIAKKSPSRTTARPPPSPASPVRPRRHSGAGATFRFPRSSSATSNFLNTRRRLTNGNHNLPRRCFAAFWD